MTLEELISKFKGITSSEEIDKELILNWLKENFQAEKALPKDFDKFAEMNRILDLLEQKTLQDAEEDIIKIVIYSLALINSKKDKIDIFKLSDKLGIDKMEKEN